MKSPRVSIMTSVFKSEKFIRHFIEDVARQTIFCDCEILFLNAHSPENEEAHILEFQRCFPENVVYKRLDKQYSIYETWNIGVDMARAELLTNWNTDDRRVFNSLDAQTRTMEADPSIDVCYGPTLTTHTPNERTELCRTGEGFGCYPVTLQSMLENNSPHCLPMWRKDLHQRFGYFDTKYLVAADYEFWLRVLKGGAKFHKLESLVGSYYRNPTGASSDPTRYASAIQEVLDVRAKYSSYEKDNLILSLGQ